MEFINQGISSMKINSKLVENSWKRGIALDMDGIIIDGMKYHVKAWIHTFNFLLNMKIKPIEIYLLEGVKGDQIIKKITECRGIILSNQEISKIHIYKRNFFDGIFKIEPIPGINIFINSILERKYSLALVTGTSRKIAEEVISELKFQDYFEVIISGDDTKFGKPQPHPYLYASKKMGVKNKNCLVIENAPAGIISAKAAKMKCLAIETYLSKSYLVNADIILPNLFEAKEWILEEYNKSKGRGAW